MNERLRILIFGAGAVGSTFGGFLSREHDVTLLGRPRYLNAIRRKGLRITGIWGRYHFRNFRYATTVKQIASPASQARNDGQEVAPSRKDGGLLSLRGAPKVRRSNLLFDIVLVTVKAYDTRAAAKQLKKIVKPGTLVLSLQNGLGNIETLHEFFPQKQVLAGRVIFGAVIPKPGHVKITVMAHPTAIGETAIEKETPRVKKITKLFKKTGIPVVSCRDVQGLLWAKVIYNCALNPLASILGCHYGYLMEKEPTRKVMNEVIEEIYNVARKMKVKLNPPTPQKYQKLFYAQLVPRTYDHHPSMLQDLRNGKRTEIGALSGAIARLGRKARVPVPVNARLAALIKEREFR